MRAADCVWLRGLLRKGPGLCHGVAGSGYVFLVMHRSVLDIPRVLERPKSDLLLKRTFLRLTGDLNYLHRALKFAEFFFTEQFR